ncbi:MAG: FKBP-type peptidyl-prolyl cis-trans isomerase N-terminal domain-containing protein, partial [Thiotrichales bacterium]|nr:FKBP-type peptidyl-prolyl cis-trans isomerase N-terminal domain-containing protein [Thiotrichales bacterium]
MKKALWLALGMSATSLALAGETALQTTEQKASYTLGVDLAKNMQQQGLQIDIKALTLGMQDAFDQKPLRLTPEEMQSAVNEVKKAMMQKQLEARKQQAEANAKAGAAFLAENKTKPGVKTT